MKRLILLAVLIISMAGVSYGEPSKNEQAPATKLEAFTAKKGVVIVKGYTEVGYVGGTGRVVVSAQEFKNSNKTDSRITGIGITVHEYGRLEREHSSMIDSDEIDSLVAGIDYISKASSDVTNQKKFEVQYRTKGDLSITVFNTSKNELSVAITSGTIGKTTAFIDFGKLPVLKNLILTAKSKL